MSWWHYIDRIHLDSLSLTLIQEDEREWREKMGKSKSKGNFVALVSTRTLTSKAFCPVRAAFDSRSFLTWKVVTRVDDWCRTSSGWRTIVLGEMNGEKEQLHWIGNWPSIKLVDSMHSCQAGFSSSCIGGQLSSSPHWQIRLTSVSQSVKFSSIPLRVRSAADLQAARSTSASPQRRWLAGKTMSNYASASPQCRWLAGCSASASPQRRWLAGCSLYLCESAASLTCRQDYVKLCLCESAVPLTCRLLCLCESAASLTCWSSLEATCCNGSQEVTRKKKMSKWPLTHLSDLQVQGEMTPCTCDSAAPLTCRGMWKPCILTCRCKVKKHIAPAS